MNTSIREVTDGTFTHEVLESLLPVVVDFWAPWCGPCKAVEPILEELASEYAEKYKFVRVNTDEHPQAPEEYAIRSVPTLCIFRNGRMVDIVLGAHPKEFIKKKLEENLTSIGSGQDGETELFSNELY